MPGEREDMLRPRKSVHLQFRIRQGLSALGNEGREERAPARSQGPSAGSLRLPTSQEVGVAEESWRGLWGAGPPRMQSALDPAAPPYTFHSGTWKGLTGSALSAIPGTAGNEGLLLQGLAGSSSMEPGEQGHQGALSSGALAAGGWAAQEPGSQASGNEGGGRWGRPFTKMPRTLGRGCRGCCATTTENEWQDEGRRCAENKALLLKAVFTGRRRPPRTKGSLG